MPVSCKGTVSLQVAVALLLIPLVNACAKAGLGACDDEQALMLAYDPAGVPYRAGQAVMHLSCGGGAFCHSAGANGGSRFGVPAGLNFDVRPVTATDAANEETEVFRDGLFRTFHYREEVYEWIIDETMPPGDVGRKVVEGNAGQCANTPPSFVLEDDSPLPTVYTSEGRGIVRNWLACSPPLHVVERTNPHPNPSYVPLGSVIPQLAEPPAATWTSIFDVVITGQTCARSFCHDCGTASADLDLSSKDFAYQSLVDVGAADTGACDESEHVRIKAGDPDASLFVQKLEDTQDCGTNMPQGGPLLTNEFIEPIREWIQAGALDN